MKAGSLLKTKENNNYPVSNRITPLKSLMDITHFCFSFHSVSVKLLYLALNQQFSCSCSLIKVLFTFVIFARNTAYPALILGTWHETSFTSPCKHSLPQAPEELVRPLL